MIVEGSTIFAMSADNQPVVRVKSGEEITFVTKDCFNNQLCDGETTMDSLDWDAVNPATGPVFVEGAKPGDILKVRIDRIQVGEIGTMAAIPDGGVLGKYVKESVIKRIVVKQGTAYFTEDIQLPCQPMIGVIGVAPAAGTISCGEPGNHGGNMDNTKIKEGAVLYLPVFCEGALLAMGDVHACMGDGEIMVTGLEIPARVTVTVDVISGESISNPILEDEQSFYTIASDENVEKAVEIAVMDMTELIKRQLHLTFADAGMLLSAAGNLQFCQVVDPKRTVRMEISKKVLKILPF